MNRPWMPLYISDYIRDTSHLRALESGAYLHLIMAYWVSGKLPNDDRQLATIAKLTDKEWKACKGVLAGFFGTDWSSHKRIDAEIAKATDISDKRRANVMRRYNKPPTNEPTNVPTNENTLHTSHSTKKEPEANASGADAPDVRTELFNRGLETLAWMSGKTPSSVRSLVGKWLKACDDEAIHVLAAIDDAATDRIVDPIPWIEARLRPKFNQRNTNGPSAPNRFAQALDKLKQHVGEIERGEEGGRPPPRLLSNG